jgi:hypothetical protein
MKKTRDIRRVIRSRPVIEGAGVHLRRAFGFHDTAEFDPFLLLDDFRSDRPEHYLKGFPWHPHRGIETITYMLDGRVEHGDSLGNRGVIEPGDVQWMTAGSGIIHQEMPEGDPAGRMGGFQLWANLPASHKMMEPRYREVKREEIPAVAVPGGATVRVISGEVGGVSGPVRDVVTGPAYLDVAVPAAASFTRATPPGHTALAYVIQGRARFCQGEDPFSYEVEGENYFDIRQDLSVSEGNLVLFGDGSEIAVTTDEEPVRFLLMSGRPLREPVAWYGPIVMNTQRELEIAFDEYRRGTFIKHGKA